ncbi:hypothetical protein [Caulobacter sp. 1776]|uniref:hypothetical protein n=1 Tax=Caulobacter sp. 1776 TaxID=3156420 RepID=UPI00339499C3
MSVTAVAPEVPLQASMATMLDVLAWEIELAGARCIYLDSMIGKMMKTVPEEQREVLVEGMHTVDLLAQQLTSLSAFARRMSALAPDDVSASVDTALGDITLGALADRMSVAFGGVERGIYDAEDAGDLDLF